MAELPAYLRPKRRVTPEPSDPVTEILQPGQSWGERLATWSSWAMLLLALAVCGILVWTVWNLIRHAPIAQIHIQGDLNPIEQQQVEQHVSPLITQGYFTTDLLSLRDAALTLPWVQHVTVSRFWPDGILVRVVSHHAIAQWGSGRLLSDQGAVFTEAEPKSHPDLPILYGPYSQHNAIMQQYLTINQIFEPLKMRVKELHLTDRMTWFVQFSNYQRMIVDQEQTTDKIKRLEQVAAGSLAPYWSKIAVADLRYRNGLALQWQNGYMPLIDNGRIVQVQQVTTDNKQSSQKPALKTPKALLKTAVKSTKSLPIKAKPSQAVKHTGQPKPSSHTVKKAPKPD